MKPVIYGRFFVVRNAIMILSETESQSNRIT